MKSDERALAADILSFVCGMFPGGSVANIPAKYLLSRLLSEEAVAVKDRVNSIVSRIVAALDEYSHEFNLTDPTRLPQAIEALRYSLAESDFSFDQLIAEFRLEPEPLTDSLLKTQLGSPYVTRTDALREHLTRQFATEFMDIVPSLPGFDIAWHRCILREFDNLSGVLAGNGNRPDRKGGKN